MLTVRASQLSSCQREQEASWSHGLCSHVGYTPLLPTADLGGRMDGLTLAWHIALFPSLIKRTDFSFL
jgi:hypothetical protein